MKLSIITVNRNNRTGLGKTLDSVFSGHSGFNDFEEIVVDGASSDGSMEVIKACADRISHWVSEADHGPYDAMGKGAGLASGEYLLFLNSGDTLLPGALARIPWDSGADFICGRATRIEGGRKVSFVPFNGEMPTFGGLYYYPISHQAVFTRRELLLRFGCYDWKRYPICADWARSLDFWLAGAKFLPIDLDVAEMEPDGISAGMTPEHRAQRDAKSVEIFGPLLHRRIRTGDKFVSLLPGMNQYLFKSERCAKAFQAWNKLLFFILGKH